MDLLFVCNVCKLEFPINEKANRYKRCIQCHKDKEKDRRIKNWKQIEQKRENYKERAKLIKKEYREKNKDKIKEYNKNYRLKKKLEDD